MYELQILHYYTISNVNYHKPESLKTQTDDRVVQSIIVTDKVTENGVCTYFSKKKCMHLYLNIKSFQNIHKTCVFHL